MITDDIKTTYHHAKWALVLRGLLGLALGIFILARPLESVAAFALVVAVWALVDGIVNVVHAFDPRWVAPHRWIYVLGGIVSVVFGVAALYFYPILSLAYAVIWTGLWLMSAGVFAIYAAVQERRIAVPWGWTMAFGLLGTVFGIVALAYPGITLAALMVVIAVFGIVGGITMLVAAGKMQSIERDVTRAARTAVRA